MILRTGLLLCILALVACDKIPGKPKPEDRWKPHSEITDFAKLFEQNCQGCHGMGSVVAASMPLDNPTFLAILPREELLRLISEGIPSKAMPGFSAAAGGPLTKDQIKILVDNIVSKKPAPTGNLLPTYAATVPGDATRGATIFANACASCHGADGNGGDKAGSVINPAYLDLVSDQYLRSIVIAGRPDLGCPDFANRIPGQAMTEADIADVTAWLITHRRDDYGQPIVPTAPTNP